MSVAWHALTRQGHTVYGYENCPAGPGRLAASEVCSANACYCCRRGTAHRTTA